MHSHAFAVKIDRCVGNCNTLKDLFSKVCVPNKTEDLYLSVFNIITGINELKTLTKHVSCKCEFDGRECNSDQWWNNDKCQCECKKCHVYEEDYLWNPATCSCKNGKYVASIMDNSAIMCDEIIESYDKEANLNKKEVTCKTQNFYILHFY